MGFVWQHTYFKAPDVRRCQITGLQGCTFVDKVIINDNWIKKEVQPVF